jgi:hypothetical protein
MITTTTRLTHLLLSGVLAAALAAADVGFCRHNIAQGGETAAHQTVLQRNGVSYYKLLDS